MSLGSSHVEELLETTFFIVIHYWEGFSETSRVKVEELLAFLLARRRDVFESLIVVDGIERPDLADPLAYASPPFGRPTLADVLPSLRGIPQLARISSEVDAFHHQGMDIRGVMALFARRLAHEHSGVVLLAVKELSAYLKDHQDLLQASVIRGQQDDTVAKITRALMDCAVRYNAVHHDVATICTECLGHIGCIDPNRVESVRVLPSFLVLHNFEDPEETKDFVLFTLEEVLVKYYRSTSPYMQGFLAYVMQELLGRCDFREACRLEEEGKSNGGADFRKWMKLSDATRQDLTPFLKSVYRMSVNPDVSIEYPIFTPGMPYATWLKSFVLDLLRKRREDHADMIFEPLSRVVRAKHPTIAEFLLPYAFVRVASGSSRTGDGRTVVIDELIRILRQQPADVSTFAERENMKRFGEVS